MPGVVKLGADTYAPSNPGLSLEALTEIRSAIIAKTAEIFDPDIFLVDKEPLGMRGEVVACLRHLKGTGARLVLGLRDVMDEPSRLAEEWRRKEAFAALEHLYDDIWIYGLPEICDPLAGIGPRRRCAEGGVHRLLSREVPSPGPVPDRIRIDEEPYILVTTGGGGDGASSSTGCLRAYEDTPTHRAAQP